MRRMDGKQIGVVEGEQQRVFAREDWFDRGMLERTQIPPAQRVGYLVHQHRIESGHSAAHIDRSMSSADTP